MRKLLLKIIKKTRPKLNFWGYDPYTTIANVKGMRFFKKDLKVLEEQLHGDPQFPITKMFPMLADKNAAGGTLSGHYFHQDLLVAKRIFQNKPVKHVDIGSRTDGFVAHVACFREIEVFDIRPIENKIKNIQFIQADFMKLKPEMLNYTDSISCLHAIEHFGLGRYGDPIDAYGHLKGLQTIQNVLKKGGKFYFSVPIGKQRIEFNAHRVFSMEYLLSLFKNKYTIDHFSYVDDTGDLHENVNPDDETSVKKNFRCKYGCGIFEMTKL